MGEGEARAIASGLREHHTLEEMQGRLVLVVCNLRPAKLAGFVSNGMVLAAKSEDGTKASEKITCQPVKTASFFCCRQRCNVRCRGCEARNGCSKVG